MSRSVHLSIGWEGHGVRGGGGEGGDFSKTGMNERNIDKLLYL